MTWCHNQQYITAVRLLFYSVKYCRPTLCNFIIQANSCFWIFQYEFFTRSWVSIILHCSLVYWFYVDVLSKLLSFFFINIFFFGLNTTISPEITVLPARRVYELLGYVFDSKCVHMCRLCVEARVRGVPPHAPVGARDRAVPCARARCAARLRAHVCLAQRPPSWRLAARKCVLMYCFS